MDEDFRYEMVVGKVLRGETHGAAEGLRHKGLKPSVGPQWEEQQMCVKQAASFIAFADAKRVHLSSDGSRVGCPAEETVASIAWDSDDNVGAVPPPIVA